MRSRYFVCAALASLGFVLVGSARTASAADPKSKKKPSSSDAIADDKGIGKTLQWEDKVMGPDDKRGELDKILKAQAINKAATERAEREKEKAAKDQAARDAKEAAAPKAQTSKRGGEVALPSLPDEGPAKGKDKGKSVDISPKLDSAQATAAPPPSKPADDKFIDKLLKEEGSNKHKKTASTDDKELLDLLATEKPKAAPAAKGKGKAKGGGETVDSLLQEVDKPAAPAPKIKHETPEWEKPEILATPNRPAAPLPPPAKKPNDGIIHVVQGAATARPAPVATNRYTSSPMPTSRSNAAGARRQVAAAPPPARAAAGGTWSDPFADAPRKATASRNTRDLGDDDEAPPPRRNTSASTAPGRSTRASVTRSGGSGDDDSWDDPFDRKTAPVRRASAPAPKPAKSEPPAHSGPWKDPFTDDSSSKPARATRGTVAMRDNKKNDASSSGGKWEKATKHSQDDDSADDGAPAPTKGRWGILKKR